MKEKEQEKVEEPAIAGTPQETAKEDAFKQLRKAVVKKVREKSDEIAHSLVESTLKGNSNNAKLVVSLVDKPRKTNKSGKRKKKNKNAEKSKRGHSLALDLASDPQCPPEDDEWTQEAERGTRKPEA